jgi:hypothetical protein
MQAHLKWKSLLKSAPVRNYPQISCTNDYDAASPDLSDSLLIAVFTWMNYRYQARHEGAKARHEGAKARHEGAKARHEGAKARH